MTIRDMAKIAGVSPSTVSKALNHAPDVSQEMCRQIAAIAERVGYQPARRRSGAQRSALSGPKVGLVYSDIRSHYYSRLVEGYTRRVRELNGVVMACDAEFSGERAAQFCDYLDKKCHVDAIIIITFGSCDLTAMPKTHALMIANSRMRASESWSYEQLGFDCFGVNVRTGILDALRTLKENGHRRIAFIGEQNGQSIRDIFEECMHSLDLSIQSGMIRMSDHRFEEAGQETMISILNDGMRPTAVVCGYDDIALGAARVLLDRGYRIPEDVSLIGVDYSQIILPNRRLLASVDSFIEDQIGIVTSHMMRRLADGDSDVVQSVAIQSVFRPNETVGCAHGEA